MRPDRSRRRPDLVDGLTTLLAATRKRRRRVDDRSPASVEELRSVGHPSSTAAPPQQATAPEPAFRARETTPASHTPVPGGLDAEREGPLPSTGPPAAPGLPFRAHEAPEVTAIHMTPTGDEFLAAAPSAGARLTARPTVARSDAKAPSPTVTAASGSARRGPLSSSHMPQIDALKGLAIIGVMAQHAFASRALNSAWDTLYAGQAVPIFFVLMGLNATASASRRGIASLSDLYAGRYWAGRLDRLLVPFLALWPLALVAAVIAHESHIGALALIGVYPLSAAPGNYFVTIMLEFAVVFPAVYWCFSRRPVLTTAGLIALDVAFELAAGQISAFSTNSTAEYIYEAAIPKYAVFIVAGMWLARIRLDRRLWMSTTLLAAVGAGYLALLHVHPGNFTWLVPSYSRSTNFISCFYAILITIVAIKLLPGGGRRRMPGWPAVEQLGKASYHIFLVQIVWFGVVSDRSWAVGAIGIVASSLLGWMFYRIPLPSLASQRQPRRPTPRASRPGS